MVTYESQILSRDLPESLVIIGAEAIGMKFAYVLVNYGVKVTIVEYLDRALPNADIGVSIEIARQYRKLGVDLMTSTKVDRVTDRGSSVTVSYTEKDGSSASIVADKVLMFVGFAPRTAGNGLENTGVAINEGGAIHVDEFMRTTAPHLYAIGDVTGKLQLAHVAEAQGVVAAETMFGAETMPLGDYQMMPLATFSEPQVASYGLTEQQARDEGYDVRVDKFPFTADGKAQGLGEPGGFVKLVADSRYGEIWGAHMVAR